MKPVFQTKYGSGEGNCLTACVASVLEVPIETLPEFCVDGQWFEMLADYCQRNDLFLLHFRHQESIPVICLNAHVIMLLRLAGTEVLHAVVGRTSLEQKRLITDADVESGASIAEDIGGTSWGWQTEIVHDPNQRGYPRVVGVSGYMLLGKRA